MVRDQIGSSEEGITICQSSTVVGVVPDTVKAWCTNTPGHRGDHTSIGGVRWANVIDQWWEEHGGESS